MTSPINRSVAHAVSNYASQAGLTMDALRESAPQHMGNLRAELMQTTGDTQTFTNEFVSNLLGGLRGGAPNVDAIERLVSNIVSQQEARMQQVNQSMGSTLQASQSVGTGQRNVGQSPLMTQMAAMAGTQTATPTRTADSPDVQNPLNQQGAAIGLQGASWGKKAFKALRAGAVAMALGAVAVTGFMGINHMNNQPNFDQNRPAIELIQEKPAAPTQGFEVVTPAPVQQDGAFGPGAGQVENYKEAAHQQMLDQQSGQAQVQQNGGQTTPAPSQDLPAANNGLDADKEGAHDATYSTQQVDGAGGGGGSVTTPAPSNGGIDEGVRSTIPPAPLGHQDVSRNGGDR